MSPKFWPDKKKPKRTLKRHRLRMGEGKGMLIRGVTQGTKAKFVVWCYERGKSYQDVLLGIVRDYRAKWERMTDGERWRPFAAGRKNGWGEATAPTRTCLYFRIPTELRDWFKVHCIKEGWYENALLCLLVERFVDNAKRNDPLKNYEGGKDD